MGTVPIVIFRGLGQSRAQGLGELGPHHFPGYRPTWSLSKRKRLYTRTREGILLRRAGNPLQPFWAPRLVRPLHEGSLHPSLLSDLTIFTY